MWHLFEGSTANELWGNVLDALRRDDARVQPSRVGETREVLHAALTLRNPRERWVSSRRPAMNPAFALAEVFWILSGRRDAKFLHYFNRSFARHAGTAIDLHGAYGYRLRHSFQIDQLDRAYEVLRANPNSRQVVLQIWHPADDLPYSDGRPRDPDIPCNTQSILKVRGGKLEWLQIIRSNDAFLGLPHNLVQFTMLQEVISGWLGIELGQYHQVSDSLHVYESDLVSLRRTSSKASSDGDVFALSRNESASVISVVVKSIEQIIDEQQTADDIARLADMRSLPDAYRNALRILIAEGARRRKDPATASAVMSLCTSTMFCQMWSDWCERLKTPN